MSTENTVAWMSALLGATFLLSTWLAWRGGNARRDVGLLGGAAVTLLTASGVAFVA